MEAANGAIEHDFHNALVPINGSHSGSSGRRTPNGGDPAPGKLFVGGLSWQTSSEKLREYFGMFGTVTDVLIMKDPVTQVGLLDGKPLRRLVGRWPDPRHELSSSIDLISFTVRLKTSECHPLSRPFQRRREE